MRFLALCLLACLSFASFADDDSHALTAQSGEPAPALQLKNLAGQDVDLAAYRGKLVLVNFWATWCPPCRREMPSLERLHRELKDAPFAILAVSVGEDADSVREFLPKLDPAPGFAILLDPRNRAARAWKVQGLPASFVVDAQGKLIYSAAGGRQFDHPEILKTLRAALPH